ncbi:MAG: peroxiredoxin family protein [Actinobacteria bacterium]|nr:MAG: peroxiredoxin family protein [Actinomycetota bacterium]
MQQVVDLQNDPRFRALGVQLLSISPDPVGAWQREGEKLGITEPMLSDVGNRVWFRYGSISWMMPTSEPGHTFILVGRDGRVLWVRDYGAMEHGGAMYVSPREVVRQIGDLLPKG